jgi:hypothetical protein
VPQNQLGLCPGIGGKTRRDTGMDLLLEASGQSGGRQPWGSGRGEACRGLSGPMPILSP